VVHEAVEERGDRRHLPCQPLPPLTEYSKALADPSPKKHRQASSCGARAGASK